MTHPPHGNPWDRAIRTRISRRRALAAGGGGAAALAALSIVGCDDGGGPESGGTLRFGAALAPSSGLDPQIEQAGGLAIFPRIYGYLLHVDSRDDSVILDHAESVEQPDDRTYVFRLRGDLRFHDEPPVNGRAVRAQDIVRTVERYRDNPVAVNKLWHTNVLESIEATDERTVRVTTKIPYVYTLSHMNAIGSGAILPAESTDGQADLTAGGPGSGPFTLDALALPDRASVRRFDGHYDAGNVRLDGMAWEFFADDTAKRRAFEELGVDVIPARDGLDAADLADIDWVATSMEPSLAYLSLGLRTDRPPFNDERLRRALDLAIDRDALLEVASQGQGATIGPINSHLGDGFWQLSDDEIVAASGGDDLEARRAEARQVIEAAGALAFRLQVADVPELSDIATLLRDQLTSVGAFVVLEPVPQLTAFLNLQQGNFDAMLISQQPYESPDVPARMYHARGPEDTNSPFAFSDPEINALIERSWGEAAREQRRDTLLQAQRLMIERRPLVQLISPVGHTAWHDYVRDMPEGLPGSLRQFYARQWLDLPVDGRPE